MKPTVMVRGVDRLGRVVIPLEIRYSLEIAEKDSLVFFIDDDKIALKKYVSDCFFCSNAEGLRDFKGKKICMSCLKKLQKVANTER